MISPHDLKEDRERLLADEGRESKAPAGQIKTERVVKLFTPGEKAAIIRSEPQTITISSSEPREVRIMPMSTIDVLAAYKLIRELIIPLLALWKNEKRVTMDEIVSVFGPEKADLIPELIELILKRGNQISKDWILNHFDFFVDGQQLLPIFLKQNALDKLLGGGGASVVQMPKTDANGAAATSRSTTEESPESSPSSGTGSEATKPNSGD